MSTWQTYPADYRAKEVQAILPATRAGECVSVVGLSGAGKSNLLGFLAHRPADPAHLLHLVDCNRLLEHSPTAFLRLVRRTLGDNEPLPGNPDALAELETLERVIGRILNPPGSQPITQLTLLFDRFDRFTGPELAAQNQAVFNCLRALRDSYKFQLTYVIATRRPLAVENELAELFHAHTIWLGPLSESDARWNVARYAGRKGVHWDESVVRQLIAFSGGYPSFLRAACEAYSAEADLNQLLDQPAVQARIEEFWRDEPTDHHLVQSGLATLSILKSARGPAVPDEQLTAKEQMLLDYFKTHPDTVCEKDELIQAIWPEDAIFEQGVRDSSLAQLVRRLRVKIEPDPADPRFIQTIPGRGYLFKTG